MDRIFWIASLALVATVSLAGCASPARTSTAPGPTTAGSSVGASQPGAPASSAVGAQRPVPAEKNPPGDIPDNQAFVPYAAAGGFSVSVPEGWSRQQTASGASFTDKLNTIRVAWSPTQSAPTAGSVMSAEVPKLKASEPAFELVSVSAVTLSAGAAVLTVLRENGAANAVTGKQYRLDVQRYTVFKSGRRVDLTLLSPVGADNVDPWRIVTRSLSWK